LTYLPALPELNCGNKLYEHCHIASHFIYNFPQGAMAHRQQTSPVPNKSLCNAPAVFMPVDL
jgi:hypothetical protein